MATLRTGMVAKWDALSGLYPVKVLAIAGQSGPCSTAQLVTFKVTRTNELYKAGDVFTCYSFHVIPIYCVRRRKYSTRIRPYDVECDQ